LARIVDEGAVENVYRIQVMNRTEMPQSYRVAANGPAGLVVSAPELVVPPTGIAAIVVRLQLASAAAAPLAGQSAPVEFEVSMRQVDGHPLATQREKSTFYVPR